ncbi:hypothetical protein ESCO_006021 [Escovopsis weberi]|uniref:Cysteine-rich interactor of PDZ three n=1 Tax=Escovopsis weberi TaxID=150374 RepID=A0A0M8MYQ6_ESCWE|nr:hypothetical protein ESCO_006021 [Escovopsis weberi]
MVCGKCLKLSKSTKLATPEVKKKSDIYHGSPASTATATSGAAGSKSKSATLGNAGISKATKNPYAQYAR